MNRINIAFIFHNIYILYTVFDRMLGHSSVNKLFTERHLCPFLFLFIFYLNLLSLPSISKYITIPWNHSNILYILCNVGKCAL